MFRFRRGHELADEQLSAYADGELAAAAATQVERHLATCGLCREKLADLRSLRSALSELPREAAPRSFALRPSDVRPAPTRGEAWGRAQAILGAATAAAFIAFGVLVGVDVGRSPSSVEEGEFQVQSVDQSEAASEATARSDTGAHESNGAQFGGIMATPSPPTAGPAYEPGAASGQADGDDSARGELGLRPEATPTATATTSPAKASGAESDGANGGGGTSTPLRAAEAALAALGGIGLAGLAFVWWRRRA